jgi:methionine aminotransferase
LAQSAFRLLPCAGTFFVLADYSAISDEPEEAFARRLTAEHRVASIPLSALYERPASSAHGDGRAVKNRRIRFCFAKREETLDLAAERLLKVR